MPGIARGSASQTRSIRVCAGHGLGRGSAGRLGAPPLPGRPGKLEDVGVAILRSVNVGKPQDVRWQGRTVHTGVWKAPVDGPAMVRRLNIDGDGQGDLAGHGGEQRAVFVYQLGSYRYWQ